MIFIEEGPPCAILEKLKEEPYKLLGLCEGRLWIPVNSKLVGVVFKAS